MSKRSQILLGAISTVISISLIVLSLEIGLRFMPVSTGVRPQPVNAQSPVFHALPNSEYTYSKEWDFKLANSGKINNVGFVNRQDYISESRSPLIAVVGDSYVEALMVPYEETLHARLARDLEGKARVYSFAFSGAPLSQYLVWAQYARIHYKPDGMIFVVIGNDFDESLMEYKNAPGFHYYVPNKTGTLSLERRDYQPNALNRMVVNKSALGNYLLRNLKALNAIKSLQTRLSSPAEAELYVGNTSADASKARIEKSQTAVRAFLNDVIEVSGLSPDKIAFVVDGNRTSIYQGEAEEENVENYFDVMRAFFMKAARNGGFQVIDMHDVFTRVYAQEQRKFEFPSDGHWSGYGHGIAAQAVRETNWLDAIIQ